MSATEKLIRSLEKKVVSLTGQVRRGEISPAESKTVVSINKLKDLDQALYDKLLQQYKVAVAEYKKIHNS